MQASTTMLSGSRTLFRFPKLSPCQSIQGPRDIWHESKVAKSFVRCRLAMRNLHTRDAAPQSARTNASALHRSRAKPRGRESPDPEAARPVDVLLLDTPVSLWLLPPGLRRVQHRVVRDVEMQRRH